MTKQGNNEDSSSKQTNSAPAANQAWRDRLNKTKQATNQSKLAGIRGEGAENKVPKRFVDSTPDGTAQKTRKGMRAG